MFKQVIEYREMQQLRKDHKQKQKMQYGIVLFSILMVLLLAMAAIEAMAPPKPAKPVVATAAQQQEIQDIESFAEIVTMDMSELKSSDIDFMGEKAKDPCYEKNARLPKEEMIAAIKVCKHL